MTEGHSAQPASDAASDTEARLRAWLARSGSAVERVAETHFSILAFTESDVYKVKKPIAFTFCDLTTLDARQRDAHQEVDLNARLAPDVYRGVVPIDDDTGLVVDYAVRMRRLDDGRRLSMRADSGEGEECVDATAARLAAFHATVADASAGAAIADLWTASVDECRALSPFKTAAADAALTEVADLSSRFLAGRADLLRARTESGRIVDGHGDLLSDDIYCEADGPRIIDCLEFDEMLRRSDSLLDVAFLAMDLEAIGRPDLAARFTRRYAEDARDTWPPSLLHHYIAYRALVRAKVAGIRAEQGHVGAPATARDRLELCLDHLRRGRVRLVLLGGLPGTGKSSVAAGLARRRGLTLLRTDEVRKHVSEPPASGSESGLNRGRYAPAQTEHVYAVMLEQAAALLHHGTSVVLDAAWSQRYRRAAAHVMAATTEADVVELRCVAPSPLARSRIRSRAGVGVDASEADTSVHEAMLASFEPWPEAVELANDAALEDTVTAAVVAFDNLA